MQGTYYIDPSLKQSFAEIEQKGVETLNVRERQIIGLVAQGLTNKEIAMQIHIAERTVRDYISSILLKLAVANRAGVAAWAMRHGLVPSYCQSSALLFPLLFSDLENALSSQCFSKPFFLWREGWVS